MASPSTDRKGGELSGEDMPRVAPTPFLTKTYQLVDDHAVDDVVSWNADGTTFIVWNQAEFARDLLPKYFKHNNFSSFIRQLNTYGFRKVAADRWEFSNDSFRRGEKQLLLDIQRRRMAISPSVLAEDGGSTADLISENERLRKQNLQLNKELTHMKNLCNSIYIMMSEYSGGGGCEEHMHACEMYMKHGVEPLELLPMSSFCEEMAAEEEMLGEKRWRESQGTSPTEHDNEMELELGIKHEPLDGPNNMYNSVQKTREQRIIQ